MILEDVFFSEAIPIPSMYGIPLFTCIYPKHQPDVGKYTSPMDSKGLEKLGVAKNVGI